MFGPAIKVEASRFRGARRTRHIRTIPWISTQEAELVCPPPVRRGEDREVWFAPNAGVVWKPEDSAAEPSTITSYQAVMLGQLDAGNRGLDTHEMAQLRRLWVADRLPDGTIGPRRRPSRGEAADWLGMNQLHSLTRAALVTVCPCVADSTHRRIAGPYSTCFLGNLCQGCGLAWELIGQAWHIPSVVTVMAPWIALAIRQWTEEQEGMRGSYPWTHPSHRCVGGDACSVLRKHLLAPELEPLD